MIDEYFVYQSDFFFYNCTYYATGGHYLSMSSIGILPIDMFEVWDKHEMLHHIARECNRPITISE